MEKTEREIWDDAVEIFALAQLLPAEGMADGISRIEEGLIRLGYAVVKKEV